jgi:HAD superfamily hydrolase (TIGR01509 family)
MAKRAVICDIGDVLLLRRGASLEAQWERNMGLPRGTFLARLRESGIVERAYTGQMSEGQVTQALSALLGLDDEQPRAVVREREEQSRYVVNEELVAYLRELHPRYQLATLSNDWPGGRRYNERHYQLSRLLAAQAMLYSYEEGLMKPAARFYQVACERLGVAPHEAVFVDNLDECIEGAREAGLEAVLYTTAPQTIDRLRMMFASS